MPGKYSTNLNAGVNVSIREEVLLEITRVTIYVMMKVSFHQDDTQILIFYLPTNASKIRSRI